MILIPFVTVFALKVYFLYFILFILAVSSIGVFALLGYSIWRQRDYNKATLPAIYGSDDELIEEEVSAFALDVLDEDPLTDSAYTSRIDDDYAFQQIPSRVEALEPEEFGLPSLEELMASELAEEEAASTESVSPASPADAELRRYYEDDDDDDLADQLAREYTNEVAAQNGRSADEGAPLLPAPSFKLSLPEDEGEEHIFGTINEEEVSEDNPSYRGKRSRPVPTDSPSP